MSEPAEATSPEIPSVLFHYTTAEGLLGILESRALWASDAEFLNDSHELEFGRAELHRALLEAAKEAEESGTDFLEHEYRGMMIRSAARFVDREERPEGGTLPAAYVTCFCEDGDLLSQWRGYGSAGGFAIGFRGADLETFQTEDRSPDAPSEGRPGAPPRLVKVGYGEAAVREMVPRAVAAVDPDLRAGPPGAVGMEYAHSAVVPALASVKDPAYAEEREWRLIAMGWNVEGGFRAGPFGIVPFVHLGFQSSAIAEVIVGPGQHSELRRSGVERMLLRLRYDEAKVRVSDVPFRG